MYKLLSTDIHPDVRHLAFDIEEQQVTGPKIPSLDC